ncbi:hypothetical protein MP477_18705 [Chryseobacterium sp. WG23]|uniref:hypothetical protein n=1 Tax=Chryseobacterium sp. WG23 TaxID=2926910 RepID=UPI00211DA77E|nr:hypothetical protein [Chryseobacterium sp. WG23]MCQ9636979.1 hypothetical protein [Chryseobacterium sp. WG23]
MYNKGDFRAGEEGKISRELQKYGNKKWRRTEKSAIEDHLKEEVRFLKTKKNRRKTIWVKITKEINGLKRSDYKRFYRKRIERCCEKPICNKIFLYEK